MDRPNIAQVVCSFPPYKGGIGNSAEQFAELLEKNGAKVVNYTPSYTQKSHIISGKNQLQTHFLRPALKYGNGAFLPQLFRLAPKHDIIYLHYPFFGGAEVIWLTKLLKNKQFKLIIHYHMDVEGLNLPGKLLKMPSDLIFNSLFKRAEIITGASLDYIKHSKLKGIYHRYPSKFREIPFGVDTTKFFPKEKSSRNEIIILFVGGLDKAHYFKGVENLIEAARILKKENAGPSWRIHIVGEGELKEYYRGKAQKAGVKEYIKFKGGVNQQQLKKEYQESDIFVLPSINKGEAFGMVLLEAMACQTPVIASDLPGVRSVFRNGEQGYTVKPNNPPDLAGKIKFLMNSPKKRQEMGDNALKLVKEKYELEKVREKLKEMVEVIRKN
jgi:glycosyltransferase involved in cell wall biosynthesis